MFLHLRNLGFAFALSTAALVAVLALQSVLLFPVAARSLGNPVPPAIDRIAICDNGRSALLLIREPMILHRDRIRFTIASFSTVTRAAPLSLPTGDFAPCAIAGARRAPLAFAASECGDLYAMDLAACCAPIHLGRHQATLPRTLACTDDGGLLLAISVSNVSCWDRVAARCLWRRDDLEISSGFFVRGTQRFFAVLPGERIVELDTHSGNRLSEMRSHSLWTVFLDISPDSGLIATTSGYGDCVVSKPGAGEPLWSMRLSTPPIAPKFSADGRILLAADERRPRVALLSAASGHLVGELTGARARIVGLTISPQGAVYAWDLSGTVSVWDLPSRTLLFQFRLEQFT